MAHIGKIKSYDSIKGTGTITPDKGGDALPFKKADLQQEGQEPRMDQRYRYETSQVDGGDACATNLQQEQGGQTVKDQASQQKG